MATHNELGKKGEQLAVDFYIKKDYEILDINWRYLKAEVDVIAHKNNTLYFIEVKTRSSVIYGTPEEFIDSKKIKLLAMAANAYVEQKGLDLEIQFDIIAIHFKDKQPVIEHIPDAFFPF